MWRRTACFVAVFLAHEAALTVFGQEQPPPPLPAQYAGVRFQIVMGRITAQHLHAGQARLCRSQCASEQILETLHVDGDGAIQSLRYERVEPRQITSMAITNGRQVHIQRSPVAGDDAIPLDFRQSAMGTIVLKLGVDGACREWRTPSLWHLFLAEPELCELELEPLLKLLRPSWRLSAAIPELETALYVTAHSRELVPRAQLAHWIQELGHRDFARRQAADRQLREFGPVVLTHLVTLDASQLTSEQRTRIRRLRQHLSNAAEDSVDRVAQWLLDDEQAWIALLNHRDAEKRHLASLCLLEIRPEASHFDPYGDEDDRQNQLAQLRLQLVGNER